jgi:hypothetical protein
MRGRVATYSHPWLLEEFRISVGVDPAAFPVLPETEAFLASLREDCSGPILRALGALGVGNERLLVSEYAAVRRAFAAAWPQADYQRFLDANIEEDTAHADFMADAADALVGWGHDPQDFFDGGQASVAARRRYYDALAARLEPVVGEGAA